LPSAYRELRRPFGCIDLRNEENKNVSRWVRFVVYWRKTSSTWLPQAAVVIGTSTRAIEQIAQRSPPSRTTFHDTCCRHEIEVLA
jgi:hypothetical protein